MSNKIELDLDQLEGAPIKDAADVVKLLTEAAELKKNGTKSAELNADLADQLKELSGQVTKMQSDRALELEAVETRELQNDALAKAYRSETDPEKKAAIREKLGKEYNESVLEVLDGSKFKNLLMTAVSKDDAQYDRKKEWRDLHDKVVVATALFGGVEKAKMSDTAKCDMDIFNQTLNKFKATGEYANDLIETYRKAAAESWDTVGDVEWIPVNLSRDYVESIWLPLELAPLFKRYTMTSPTFKLPFVGGRARASQMGQTTTNADHYTLAAETSQRTSSDITFTAKKLGVAQGYSDEIEQDAIVPTTELIMDSIRDAHGASIEDTVLNGDATGFATLDNASGGNELWTTAATALGRNLWHGIRKNTQTACKIDTDGVLSVDQMRNARKKMGRYGKNPAQLVWVMSVNSLMDVLGLPEVITVDKYGPGATILQGEIGRIDNIRIIISEFVYTNLATTGLYTGTGNTRTAMYLVWLPAHAFGDRKMMRIEQDRAIVSQHNIVVGSMRLDFQDLQGSETTEAWLYDLAA